MNRSSDHVTAKENYGMIFLGISTINRLKDNKVPAPKTRYMIMVDNSKSLKFSYLFQENNGIIDLTCVKFRKWRQGG